MIIKEFAFDKLFLNFLKSFLKSRVSSYLLIFEVVPVRKSA